MKNDVWIKRSRQVSREELAAWYDQTRSRFNIQMFPGDHFFLDGKESDGLLEVISKDIRLLAAFF